MARKSEEYNRGQEQAVAQFNRGTNQANAEAAQKASIANMQNNELLAQTAMQAAKVKQAEDLASSQAISNNLSTFWNNLGKMGEDLSARDQADMLIKSGAYGTLNQKPSHWSKKEWEDYQNGLKAKGGKINRKRRGGLTY